MIDTEKTRLLFAGNVDGNTEKGEKFHLSSMKVSKKLNSIDSENTTMHAFG
jgi:hypothetical protein